MEGKKCPKGKTILKIIITILTLPIAYLLIQNIIGMSITIGIVLMWTLWK